MTEASRTSDPECESHHEFLTFQQKTPVNLSVPSLPDVRGDGGAVILVKAFMASTAVVGGGGG